MKVHIDTPIKDIHTLWKKAILEEENTLLELPLSEEGEVFEKVYDRFLKEVRDIIENHLPKGGDEKTSNDISETLKVREAKSRAIKKNFLMPLTDLINGGKTFANIFKIRNHWVKCTRSLENIHYAAYSDHIVFRFNMRIDIHEEMDLIGFIASSEGVTRDHFSFIEYGEAGTKSTIRHIRIPTSKVDEDVLGEVVVNTISTFYIKQFTDCYKRVIDAHGKMRNKSAKQLAKAFHCAFLYDDFTKRAILESLNASKNEKLKDYNHIYDSPKMILQLKEDLIAIDPENYNKFEK